jgi:cob(I)alamin adenosyltransferase
MVYLSRIYTKTGDQGETALGNGVRVLKDHPRVAAYGCVDELNAVMGLLRTAVDALAKPALAELLRQVQNDLFDVGADLCRPAEPGEPPGKHLRVSPNQVLRLEHSIDVANADLKPLTSFVLPGGQPAAAWCHLARTICRRAERDVVTLMNVEAINPQVLIYLNRLSDWLFVMARLCNDKGQDDVLWVPGQTQKPPGEHAPPKGPS